MVLFLRGVCRYLVHAQTLDRGGDLRRDYQLAGKGSTPPHSQAQRCGALAVAVLVGVAMLVFFVNLWDPVSERK